MSFISSHRMYIGVATITVLNHNFWWRFRWYGDWWTFHTLFVWLIFFVPTIWMTFWMNDCLYLIQYLSVTGYCLFCVWLYVYWLWWGVNEHLDGAAYCVLWVECARVEPSSVNKLNDALSVREYIYDALYTIICDDTIICGRVIEW